MLFAASQCVDVLADSVSMSLPLSSRSSTRLMVIVVALAPACAANDSCIEVCSQARLRFGLGHGGRAHDPRATGASCVDFGPPAGGFAKLPGGGGGTVGVGQLSASVTD